MRGPSVGRHEVLLNRPVVKVTAIRVAYILLAVLALALIPALVVARLPFQIDLAGFAGAYWGGTAVQAVAVAIILSILGFPSELTLTPLFRRYWEQKPRFLILGTLLLWMVFLFGPWLGLTVVIDAMALAELFDRKKAQFGAALTDILVPAFYLFVGVLLVYLLNHAIAGIKFAGAYDSIFEKADQILFRTSVAAISQWMVLHLPTRFFSLMELVYFSLFGQVGAALVLTALLNGRKHAMRYVETLLTAYAMAVICFFLWPSIGPFSLYSPAARSYLHSMPTFWTQQTILLKAQLLNVHGHLRVATTVNLADYYIGFPSMHVALPVIAIWFLRKWRKVAFILVAFDVVLLLSIVALQWHYLVDLVGGLIVAGVAIMIDRIFLPRRIPGYLLE